MAQLRTGSLNLTKIIEQAKAGHSAFKKGSDGNIWVNIKAWLNDDVDKLGNDTSIQLNSTKEKRDAEGNIYIGNMKLFEKQETPLSNNDMKAIPPMEDLPF